MSDMFNEYVERCAMVTPVETMKFELWWVRRHPDIVMFQLTIESRWRYATVSSPDALPRNMVLQILKDSIRIAEL